MDNTNTYLTQYSLRQSQAREEKDMEWRIRENERGFYAEYGVYIQSGIEAGFKPGCYMPGFHVSGSSRFDTRKQAVEYIKRKEKEAFVLFFLK